MTAAEICELSVDSTQTFGNVLSTSTASPGGVLELWREHVRATCGELQVTADREVFRHGTIRTDHLAAAGVSSISADPHSVIWSYWAADHEDETYVYLWHVLSGTAWLFQDGRMAVTGAGDVVCFDSSRPYTLSMPDPFSIVALRVQHSVLRLRIGDTAGVTARPWSDGSGVAALIGNALSGLDRHLGDLPVDVADTLGASFVSLVGLLLTEQLHQLTDDSGLVRRALIVQVKRFGREYLGDPDLRPRTLAERHYVSMRYLQQLFADDGTSPARWIREERLARCYADLRDSTKNRLTVAAIGERWGLVNASHLSRQFRVRYGISPRELRNRTQSNAA